MTHVQFFYDTLLKLVLVKITHSNMAKICKSTGQIFNEALIFDISGNIIKRLQRNCFEFVANVTFLNASMNRITRLADNVFYK